METELDYIKRATHHAEMRELFPNSSERFQMAKESFRRKWLEASVTVTKLDGSKFFID